MSRNRCAAIDVHDLLANEMSKQTAEQGANAGDYRFGLNQPPVVTSQPGAAPVVVPQALTAPLIGDVGNEDYTLYFESRYREYSSITANGELTFDIPKFNNSADVKNCVQIRLDDFYFPRVTGPAGSPDYLFFKRIYMRIVNLPSTQGTIGYNNNQFHFELDIDDLNGYAFKVVPVANLITLQRAIGTLSTLQIQFMRQPGFQPIPLPADVFVVAAVPGSVPASFVIRTPNVSTSVIGAVGALPAPGIAVYFSDFSSANPTLNVAVTEPCGLFVTNITSATQFEVGSLSFATLGTATQANIMVAKNRIAFVMRFTTIRNQTTNYAALQHV